MKSPIKIGIVLIVLCIAIGTMFSFYEHKKIENVSSIYGVIDLETVVKAHPKYSEYFKLEAEYDNLIKRNRNILSLLHLIKRKLLMRYKGNWLLKRNKKNISLK